MTTIKPFKVDFSAVADSSFLTPGKYPVKVKSIDRKDSSNGNPQLVFTLECITGPSKGRTINYYITLTQNSLWVLRNFMEALGLKVPKSVVTIKPNDYINKTLGIEVGEQTRNDKTYSTVLGVYPLTTTAGEDEDDDDLSSAFEDDEE